MLEFKKIEGNPVLNVDYTLKILTYNHYTHIRLVNPKGRIIKWSRVSCVSGSDKRLSLLKLLSRKEDVLLRDQMLQFISLFKRRKIKCVRLVVPRTQGDGLDKIKGNLRGLFVFSMLARFKVISVIKPSLCDI